MFFLYSGNQSPVVYDRTLVPSEPQERAQGVPGGKWNHVPGQGRKSFIICLIFSISLNWFEFNFLFYFILHSISPETKNQINWDF